jgi:hypothetical protein
MVAELRKIGKYIAIYTNEVPVYHYLDSKLIPDLKIPYVQNGKLVGYDFYYNAKLRRVVRQVIKGQLLLGI